MDTMFEVLKPKDYDKFAEITGNAYTAAYTSFKDYKKASVDRLVHLENDEITTSVGGYRDDELVGCMRLYDFYTNIHTEKMMVGGLGSVAVHLLHKKEKIAKDIVFYSIEHFRKKGYAIEMLYPFRPDFYKKMGFGYGTKLSEYRFKPQSLIKGETKGTLRFVDKEYEEQLIECHNRSIEGKHGMVIKDKYALHRILQDDSKRIVACFDGDTIKGYVIFRFEKVGKNFLVNDIHIEEFTYEDRDTFKNLLTFLHSQGDQINEIVYNTFDESFYHMLSDVRSSADYIIPHVFHESNIQGVGLMYRVIDVNKFFELLANHKFGDRTFKIKLNINDNIVDENNTSFYLDIKEGKITLVDKTECDVESSMDISEFSSMVMGTVEFKKLYKYGLVTVSDVEYIRAINDTFRVEDKPECITRF